MIKTIQMQSWAACLCFILLSFGVSAGVTFDCETTQSGDWDQASTWINCNGTYPGEDDNGLQPKGAIIKDGHTVNLPLEALEIAYFTMEANTVLNIDTPTSLVWTISGREFDAELGQINMTDDTLIAAITDVMIGAIDGNAVLIVNSPGRTMFNGAVGSATPLKSVATDAAGRTELRFNYPFYLNGSQATQFNDPVRIGPSARTDMVQLGTGDIEFNSTLSSTSGSPHQITIETANSNIVFNGDVSVGILTTNGGGTTQVNANIQTARGGANTGDMTFNNTVQLLGSYTFTATGVGADISFNGNVTDDGNALTPSIMTVDSEAGISVVNAGGTFLPLDGFVASNTATLAVASVIWTTGAQSYTGPVIQTGDVIFLSLQDKATFNAGLDGGGFDTVFDFSADLILPIKGMTNINHFTTGSQGKTILRGNFNSAVNQVHNNPIELDSGAAALTAAQIEVNEDVNLGTSNTLTIDTTSDQSVVAAAISGASASLFKQGSGILTVQGDIAIDGAIIAEAGSLLLNGTVTDSVTAENNAIVGGEGSLNGGLTLTDTATLAPGNSPGILDVGSLTMGTNSALDIEIEGSVVGSQYDQLMLNESATLDGNLMLSGSYNAVFGDQFVVINNNGFAPINGTFLGLAEGAIVNNTYQITYQGGDGNDVVLLACSQDGLVTTNADSGPGSLRQIITDACDNTVVTFELTVRNITFLTPIDVVAKNIVIDGDAETFDGGNASAIFDVADDAGLSISRINMINADSGIGAIRNRGVLNLSETYFANNLSSGINGLGGGAIVNNGSMNIDKSSFFQNNSSRGGAIFNDGNGDTNITNSTFYQNGNVNTSEGGALHNRGVMTLTNVSIVDSGDGGSAAGNSIFNWNVNAVLTLNNTLIDGSGPSAECNNSNNAIVNGTHYFISDGSCGAPIDGNAGLLSWGANGGFANTILLDENSPLINVGDNATCTSDDQLGISRPQGADCDVGAIEYVDAVAPEVVLTSTEQGSFEACDNVFTPATSIQITFSEPMLNLEDVFNYELISAGSDQSFTNIVNNRGDDDDVTIPFVSVVSDNHPQTPTVTLAPSITVPEGLLRLFVLSDITDEFNNPVDDGGYSIQFRVDSGNYFKLGHFDCNAPFMQFPGWDISGAPIAIGPDVEGSNASRSVSQLIFTDNPVTLSQCVNVNTSLPLFMQFSLRHDSTEPLKRGVVDSFELEYSCQQYDEADCMGTALEILTKTSSDFSSEAQWTTVKERVGLMNPQALSFDCAMHISPNQTRQLDFFIDAARLTAEDLIFMDGFETEPKITP
ncbi:choice-of-anchor Q domain-containing protein [Marinicella sp. W31]|uniref:choice-of-anchor Q domain-containing protein n=1 Tax=Marinicella sp. W31 TaxID=3023713 RepID=UPI0037568957